MGNAQGRYVDEYVANTSIELSVMIQSDHHQVYILAIWGWAPWPPWLPCQDMCLAGAHHVMAGFPTPRRGNLPVLLHRPGTFCQDYNRVLGYIL